MVLAQHEPVPPFFKSILVVGGWWLYLFYNQTGRGELGMRNDAVADEWFRAAVLTGEVDASYQLGHLLLYRMYQTTGTISQYAAEQVCGTHNATNATRKCLGVDTYHLPLDRKSVLWDVRTLGPWCAVCVCVCVCVNDAN